MLDNHTHWAHGRYCWMGCGYTRAYNVSSIWTLEAIGGGLCWRNLPLLPPLKHCEVKAAKFDQCLGRSWCRHTFTYFCSWKYGLLIKFLNTATCNKIPTYLARFSSCPHQPACSISNQSSPGPSSPRGAWGLGTRLPAIEHAPFLTPRLNSWWRGWNWLTWINFVCVFACGLYAHLYLKDRLLFKLPDMQSQ